MTSKRQHRSLPHELSHLDQRWKPERETILACGAVDEYDLTELTADEALSEQVRFYFSSLNGLHESLMSDDAIGLLSLSQPFDMSNEFRQFHPVVRTSLVLFWMIPEQAITTCLSAQRL